ncbi:MAG: hypothetical protein K2X82_08630 [Gemmataceae bacterium]|nr:hypothetical protein [Gemmataceae bacterium]
MTPTALPSATDNGRPPEGVAEAVRVYVYDPLDPARRGEVREVRPDQPGELVRALAAGRSLAFVNLDAEVNIYLAAEFLNLPVSAVRSAIDDGRLPAVEPHRLRLRFAHVVTYRDALRAARQQAAEERRAIERELGMGD